MESAFFASCEDCVIGKRMEDINNIADYFIWFANEQEDLITPWRLQSLCYFAEVLFIAQRNQLLTGEYLDGDMDGSSSKKLKERFRKFKNNPVNHKFVILGEGDYVKPEISEEIESHLKKVIRTCWGYGPFELHCMIVEENPWRLAYDEAMESYKRQVDQDSIRDFYVNYIERHKMKEFYDI